MQTERALRSWVTFAAGVLSAGLVLLPPAAWFAFSHERMAGGVEAEAEISAHMVSQVISANPTLWEFERVRLGEYLSRRPRKGDPEIRRIVALDGEVIAESSDPLPRPWLGRSQPILDAGEPVGRVEIYRSLRPLVATSGFLALLLTVPAALAFYVLRTLPLQALRRTEGALRRERDAAQKYLDVAGVAFLILDGGGHVALINRKGAELLGRPAREVLGRDWFTSFVDPADRDHLPRSLASDDPHTVVSLEYAVLRPTGDRRFVSWYATALDADGGGKQGMLLSGVDITHQRQLEERLRSAEKLRAVGQLAGGLAHDFNNILAAVRSRAAALRADLAIGSPHRLDAEEILVAADRAAALTRSLLTFSRRQAMDTGAIDLRDLLLRSERRLSRLLPPEISLSIAVPSEPVVIEADALQLEQVLAHLVTNARDAVRGEGRIAIRAAVTAVEPDEARRLGLDAPGGYATVAVSDTGIGLDAESRARLFEPFYTTKEVGKGTGLGLAIAFGVIELHRGTIRVDSEPGIGTTVTLLLPLGPAAPDPAREERPPPASVGEPHTA